MKQLGNLALACARRPECAALCAAWDNDAQICRIIHEPNFGKFSVEKAE